MDETKNIRNFIYYRDINFLEELTKYPIKDFYVNIIILDWYEKPIHNIEGQIITGNFTIDGKSAIRRTGNLTAIVRDNTKEEISNYFSLNKKVKIEVGFDNRTTKYTENPIVWFPLGIYVITGCSIQNSLQGLTLSVQLKDKMCLLNGECGGVLPAATSFDHRDTLTNQGEWIVDKPTIYQIIQELVHHFGKEQLGKIIISDLQTISKQVMKWTGNATLHIFHFITDENYEALKSPQYIATTDEDDIAKYHAQQKQARKNKKKRYDKQWVIETGKDAGFTYTPTVYPGELIGNAGDSVVTILDKIKNTLGNFEYFYDIFGNFVFQQIKNYLNNSKAEYIIRAANQTNMTPIDYISSTAPQDIYLNNGSTGKSVFQFNNSKLINSFSNNPQYNMVKNDFVVWGSKKTGDNTSIPIRYHLAIDKKPVFEKGIKYKVFKAEDEVTKLQHWYKPIEFSTIADMKKNKGTLNCYYLCDGIIYRYVYKNGKYQYEKCSDLVIEQVPINDWRTQLYFQGVLAQQTGLESNDYYAELKVEWPKIYDIKNGDFKKKFKKDPSQLTYFLDFLDSSSNFISNLSVDVIGRRTQVWNNDKINCVFESEIPELIFINTEADSAQIAEMRAYATSLGQEYYQVPPEIYSNLVTGGTQESAFDMIKQILQDYSSYNETIQIQTLPIYFLQPNTRITVNDVDSNIYGDYMINSMSFSFDNSSFLNITASKALEKV